MQIILANQTDHRIENYFIQLFCLLQQPKYIYLFFLQIFVRHVNCHVLDWWEPTLFHSYSQKKNYNDAIFQSSDVHNAFAFAPVMGPNRASFNATINSRNISHSFMQAMNTPIRWSHCCLCYAIYTLCA